jgi:hypothetical protein
LYVPGVASVTVVVPVAGRLLSEVLPPSRVQGLTFENHWTGAGRVVQTSALRARTAAGVGGSHVTVTCDREVMPVENEQART